MWSASRHKQGTGPPVNRFQTVCPAVRRLDAPLSHDFRRAGPWRPHSATALAQYRGRGARDRRILNGMGQEPVDFDSSCYVPKRHTAPPFVLSAIVLLTMRQ